MPNSDSNKLLLTAMDELLRFAGNYAKLKEVIDQVRDGNRDIVLGPVSDLVRDLSSSVNYFTRAATGDLNADRAHALAFQRALLENLNRFLAKAKHEVCEELSEAVKQTLDRAASR